MLRRLVSISFLSLILLAGARAQSSVQPDRSRDAAAVRAHIESIFQAFIDWDVDKIYGTHSADWRGFLEGSQVPIKGIDEYMKANGIDWPRDKGSKPYPNPERGYRMKDFDVVFPGPDLAVANFIGQFYRKADNVTTNSLHIMDVYAKRDGNWIQVASHTVVDPAWRAEQASLPGELTPEMRQRILTAREAVWRAYFANDRAALERLIPAETIAIEGDGERWSDRAAIFAGAKDLADGGVKLVKLEFPKTEIQVYGNTVVLYTTYLYELDAKGKHDVRRGRGTEIFVRRGNELVNVGWHLDAGK